MNHEKFQGNLFSFQHFPFNYCYFNYFNQKLLFQLLAIYEFLIEKVYFEENQTCAFNVIEIKRLNSLFSCVLDIGLNIEQ